MTTTFPEPDDPRELWHVRHLDADRCSYATLLAEADRSGRCPFWIGHRGAGGPRDEPPADPRAVRAAVDRADPAAILEDWWPGPCPMYCGCRDPFPDRFPGLWTPPAARMPARADAVRAAVEFAGGPSTLWTLAVAPAFRPADVVAVTGWAGSGNYPHQGPHELSAVLRSWEDRFGAMLVLMDPSVLYLSVAAPPRTDDECERVAAEHFSFCLDQMDPQDGTEWDLRRYAGSIRGARFWRFWWD